MPIGLLKGVLKGFPGTADQVTEKLHYSIARKTATVHDLLLQNSNGDFKLVMWGEKVHGAEDVNVNFGKKMETGKHI